MLFCVIKMRNVINLAVELSRRLMQCFLILVDIIPDASVVKDIYLTADSFFLGTSWLLQKRDQDLLLLLHSGYRPTEYCQCLLLSTKQQQGDAAAITVLNPSA